MNRGFFSYLRKYGVLSVRYSFFMFNLALLVGLSVKTVNLWIADPFNFADTLAAYPEEPEFLDKSFAENQFWIALCVETVLFILGGFLCYELLIKQKTFHRSLIAPLVVAFLWTAGESIHLFLPATEKVQQINTCKAMQISWDVKKHKCRLMELELKRFEQLKLRKHQTSAVQKTVPATPVKAGKGKGKTVGNTVASPAKAPAKPVAAKPKTAEAKPAVSVRKNNEPPQPKKIKESPVSSGKADVRKISDHKPAEKSAP